MFSLQCLFLKLGKGSCAHTPSLVKAPRKSCPGHGEVFMREIRMEGKGWKCCCMMHVLGFPVQADNKGMGSPPASQLHPIAPASVTASCRPYMKHWFLITKSISVLQGTKPHPEPAPGQSQDPRRTQGPLLALQCWLGIHVIFPSALPSSLLLCPGHNETHRSSQCSWQLGNQLESCFIFRNRPKYPVMKT